MREILIKSSNAANHHRKNLSIIEMIDENGMVARAEKKFSYYVSQQSDIEDPEKLKTWMDEQATQYHKKERHVSIKKILDPKTGVGKMIYRVIGSFYVVQDMHIFAVVFMHSIKFDMLSGNFPQGNILDQSV